MKECQIAWLKHYGWLEIIVQDHGQEFMGSEFQNPAGAAGVLTMPIDSQSPSLKGRRSLKPQWPSVVKRETDIAIGQVFLRISACLVPACVCLEVC